MKDWETPSKKIKLDTVICSNCFKELTQDEIDMQLKVVGADDIDLAHCDDCELDNYCIHLQTHDV